MWHWWCEMMVRIWPRTLRTLNGSKLYAWSRMALSSGDKSATVVMVNYSVAMLEWKGWEASIATKLNEGSVQHHHQQNVKWSFGIIWKNGIHSSDYISDTQKIYGMKCWSCYGDIWLSQRPSCIEMYCFIEMLSLHVRSSNMSCLGAIVQYKVLLKQRLKSAPVYIRRKPSLTLTFVPTVSNQSDFEMKGVWREQSNSPQKELWMGLVPAK